MTLWIAWSVFVSALVTIAAVASERISAAYGRARRGIWMASMVLSAFASLVVASRTRTGSRELLISSASLSGSIGTFDAAVRIAGRSMNSGIQRSLNIDAVADRTDRLVGVAWATMSFICFVMLGASVGNMRRRRGSWVETITEIGPVLMARDEGPAVVGFIEPRIVMPGWALERSDETRSLMLRHELEHLRAGDSRVLLAAAVLCALLPWNAALWFMSRRLRLAIEVDCDTRVIRSFGAPRAYGLMLLDVGDRYTARLPASALLFERGAQLEARIDAMTTPRPKRPMAIAAISAAITVLVLASAAWTPRPTPFRATTPSLRVLGGPQLLPGNPAPRYPDAMRHSGEEGVVVAAFVTDKSGIPDTASVSIAQATNESFASSVKTVLPRMRYSGPGAVVFVCRFKIATDSPRPSSYVSPQFIAGADTSHVIVVTGVFR
jgi:beta-lactamase regulating signal transducer with metallopeptidase domain